MSLRSQIMANSSLGPLKVPAFTVLDAIQDTQPAYAIDALTLTLVLICQSTGLDAHELVTRAGRQIRDADALRIPHLDAIRDVAAGVFNR